MVNPTPHRLAFTLTALYGGVEPRMASLWVGPTVSEVLFCCGGLRQRMSVCVFACTDRREVRRTDKGEGGRRIGKDTEQESSSF